MLNGVSAARRTREKPPSRITSAKPLFAGLRAERRADFLVQRGRHADTGREGVEDAPDRVEIVGQAVAGHRLDQHQRAVGLQRLARMRGRADRIAHVVQGVEHGDEIEADAREVLRARRLEADIAEALRRASWHARSRRRGSRSRRTASSGTPCAMMQRRCAMTAADVGHLGAALELADHAVERRQPLGHQMRLVAGAEEALDAAEQAVAVIAPADALAGLEGLGRASARRRRRRRASRSRRSC